MENTEQVKPSILSVLTPVQLFIGGIVTGLLVLCTLGFFIMLGMRLGGGAQNGGGERIVVGNPSGAQGNDAPGQPVSVRAVDDKNDHIRGAKNAKVTIVSYSDFECPFCKRFHETMKQLVQKYPNDVRWVFRQLPLDSLHSQARKEALASECAAEQGKFWEFSDLIFAVTTSNDGLDLNKLPDYAKQVGLNVSKFNECVSSAKFASAVQEDEQDAQSAGAQGTPYSVAIGPSGQTEIISGAQPLNAVEAVVQGLLK